MRDYDVILRLLRKSKGLSIDEISVKLELDSKYVSLLESGEELPSAETINKYSELFNFEKGFIDYLADDKLSPVTSLILHIMKSVEKWNN
jgi:transcriptional regulator with XRE-family HTH domain